MPCKHSCITYIPPSTTIATADVDKGVLTIQEQLKALSTLLVLLTLPLYIKN